MAKSTTPILEVEMICFNELIRLCFRNRRYLSVVLAMYARTINTWRRTNLLRATYCVARFVDDVLDGDRDIKQDPEAFVNRLVQVANHDDAVGEDRILRLAQFVFQELRELAREGDDPAKELLELIKIMVFDRKRARERLLLRYDELRQHHRHTFAHSLNVALCIADAKIRADSLTSVIEAQSSLYAIRDIQEDLGRGLVNIPFEVLQEVGKIEAFELSPLRLLERSAVRRWFKEELAVGVRSAERAERFVAGCDDHRARMVLWPLCRGLKGLAKRLPKREVVTSRP